MHSWIIPFRLLITFLRRGRIKNRNGFFFSKLESPFLLDFTAACAISWFYYTAQQSLISFLLCLEFQDDKKIWKYDTGISLLFCLSHAPCVVPVIYIHYLLICVYVYQFSFITDFSVVVWYFDVLIWSLLQNMVSKWNNFCM